MILKYIRKIFQVLEKAPHVEAKTRLTVKFKEIEESIHKEINIKTHMASPNHPLKFK